jgi:hypothetical protein
MAVDYDFTASSEDRFRVWCADESKDAITGIISEAAIDLTGKTVKMRYKIGTGALVTRTMTLVLPQTGTDKGKAYYDWLTDELTAGELTGEITIEDSDTTPHRQPGEFVLQIKAALA